MYFTLDARLCFSVLCRCLAIVVQRPPFIHPLVSRGFKINTVLATLALHPSITASLNHCINASKDSVSPLCGIWRLSLALILFNIDDIHTLGCLQQYFGIFKQLFDILTTFDIALTNSAQTGLLVMFLSAINSQVRTV